MNDHPRYSVNVHLGSTRLSCTVFFLFNIMEAFSVITVHHPRRQLEITHAIRPKILLEGQLSIKE